MVYCISFLRIVFIFARWMELDKLKRKLCAIEMFNIAQWYTPFIKVLRTSES